jgi:hypothetical protein
LDAAVASLGSYHFCICSNSTSLQLHDSDRNCVHPSCVTSQKWRHVIVKKTETATSL